jgi:hypothetical protein
MPRPSREAVMTALFNALVESIQTQFTADTAANSTTLGSPSSLAGLFIGLPVVGGSIPRGAVIATLTPELTLSLPASENGSAVELSSGWQTTGRRVQMWTQVPNQPAMFLRDGDEDLSYQGQNQLQTMAAEVWIYSNLGENPNIAPITPLNNLLDAVASVFAPDSPTNQFTLGGLVSWCRMGGKVVKIPGDINGQAVALAEVEIFVP